MLNGKNILASTLATAVLNTSNSKVCLDKFSISSCFLAEFSGIIAQFILAFTLFPQILYLFYYRKRYIDGISYLSIIIRIVALILLITADAVKWVWIVELIATIIIFLQIIIGLNAPDRNKCTFISISLVIWILSSGIIIYFREQKDVLKNIGYALLAVHMLPQLLLNSLLQTAKALLKISILLFAICDLLLFSSLSTRHASIIHLISIYYSFSFFLVIYLQSMNYLDAHIYTISRIKHTTRKPDDDTSTKLDTTRTSAKVSLQKSESLDADDDIIYQPVTTTESSIPKDEEPVWYAIGFGAILCIDIVFTILFIYRAWTPWIISIPISIPVILYALFLLRTKLGASKIESLRKIL